MSEKSEALRLAEVLDLLWMDGQTPRQAAAELRRQREEIETLKAQRDALLEAVQCIVDFVDGPAEAKRPDVFFLRISKARAAIKAVEEGK